jgi:hypothetical protein
MASRLTSGFRVRAEEARPGMTTWKMKSDWYTRLSLVSTGRLP